MRHRKQGRQLRRTSEQKLALMKSLAKALIERGAIETTEAKAKELRPFIEKLITKAKTGTLHNRRLAGAKVPHRATADKLFQEIGPSFATRNGGYTRILKTGHRKGDGAEMARIELIGTASPTATTSRTRTTRRAAPGSRTCRWRASSSKARSPRSRCAPGASMLVRSSARHVVSPLRRRPLNTWKGEPSGAPLFSRTQGRGPTALLIAD
jgi:large subunit ribosomal protein L17